MIQNVERTKNEKISSNLLPIEGNKKLLRDTCNFYENLKTCNNVQESKKDAKESSSVSVEKCLEKNKSAPKHFKISLIYNQNTRHIRKYSEGNMNKLEINNLNERNEIRRTKTTKDSSFNSLKLNNIKGTNLEVESIEELHYIYNNLYQQNKALAFKFENLEIEEEVINEFGKSIYIN